MEHSVQTVEQDYRADSKPAKDNDTAPLQSDLSSRAKAKKFVKEKGPGIAKAAVTIGVLVFNVASLCC
jgi:hypothetical protein